MSILKTMRPRFAEADVILCIFFQQHKLYHKDLGNLLSDTNLLGTPQSHGAKVKFKVSI